MLGHAADLNTSLHDPLRGHSALKVKEVLHLKLSLNEKEGTCRWHSIQLCHCVDGMEKPDLHKQTTTTLCR
jgi:hypothetical protein